MKRGSILILFLNPIRILLYSIVAISSPKIGFILIVIEFIFRLYDYFSTRYSETGGLLTVKKGFIFERTEYIKKSKISVFIYYKNPIFMLFSVSALRINQKNRAFYTSLVLPSARVCGQRIYKAGFLSFLLWGIFRARTFYLFLNSSILISVAAKILSIISGYSDIFSFLSDTILENRSVAYGVCVLIIFFISLYILSAAIYTFLRFFTFFGFSFYKNEKSVIAEYGIFDKRKKEYKISDISGCILKENPFMRIFKVCSFELLTFESSIVFPVMKKSVAIKLIAGLYPGKYRRKFSPAKSAKRYLICGARVITTAIFCIVLFFFKYCFFSFISFIIFTIFIIDGIFKYRSNKIEICDSLLKIVNSGISRDTIILKNSGIFEVKSVSALTRQRHGICTIIIKTASLHKNIKLKSAGFSVNCRRCINRNFTDNTLTERRMT